MLDQEREKLRAIKTFSSLVRYLRDELDWPIESDDFDSLVFDYEAEELGIDPETAVKIDEIKQLRPLVTNQPWGIFFIKFEPKRLPVVVLRRILNRLVIKKRASANRSEQASWNLDDLLFISSYGEDQQRQITFAHFSQDRRTGDLPTLKVMGWDDADTALHLDYCHQELKGKLRWPDDDRNSEDWREKWSSAFILRHREVITTSKELAMCLADLARRIRRRANTVLAFETERGHLRQLYKSFQEALIHDLSEDDFADMYAQTIAYGLLAARVSRPTGVTAGNVAEMIPITNPFLRDMLGAFLTAGGRKKAIDFDEFGVQEVVELLNSPDTHMEAILRDFGNLTQQEDPVIHFYELFLSEYDKKKKAQRGVFFTPRPVVSYIVRSVHELLQSEFELEDGLADITSWGDMAKRKAGIEIPDGVSPDEPFVQILDPATGTGTFLVEVIDIVHKTMRAKWIEQGHMALETLGLWSEYVHKHLLPRLYGFELMMAPYAIAHMKLGVKLYETGYTFGVGERVHVYLTNSLEPARDSMPRRVFEQWSPALADEAKTVNLVKLEKCFTVVVGNPPYSVISANLSGDVRQSVEPYRYVDGAPIRERSMLRLEMHLQDDYVKFFRDSEARIAASAAGIVSLITNNGYLDSLTLRGMRCSLRNTFDSIWVLNLHGNRQKTPSVESGKSDRNVFDIEQGVSIFMGCRAFAQNTKRTCLYRDLVGPLDEKFRVLLASTMSQPGNLSIAPRSPFYFLVPIDATNEDEYLSGTQITEIFPRWISGIVTAHDRLVVDFEDTPLMTKTAMLRDPSISDQSIREELSVKDNAGWKVDKARKALRATADGASWYKDVAYRPMDNRRINYHPALVWCDRRKVMNHMMSGHNIAISTCRQLLAPPWRHLLVTRHLQDDCYISDKSRERSYMLPLYLYPQSGAMDQVMSRGANISLDFVKRLTRIVGLAWIEDGYGDLISGGTVGPGDVLDYVYGLLHSPEYRRRYSELLKTDFPRVFLAGSLGLFRGISELGADLVALHLLESTTLETRITRWHGATPSHEVEKVTYSDETVWIDKAKTEGFRGVSLDVWGFHIGAYQVCNKWLKSRKGRVLSADEITHYQRIVVALNETLRLMKEVDEFIEQHGGWPRAFTKEDEYPSQPLSSH